MKTEMTADQLLAIVTPRFAAHQQLLQILLTHLAETRRGPMSQLLENLKTGLAAADTDAEARAIGYEIEILSTSLGLDGAQDD